MDKAARRFASWVLGIHGLVLALLVVIVAFASYGFYSNARRQALDQLKIRQELLAGQTARGIEGFYRGVNDTLTLQDRADFSNGNITPLIWEQLRGQATRLMVFDRQSGKLLDDYRDGGAPPTPAEREQLEQLALTSKPGADSSVISVQTKHRTMIAAVPMRSIESRFLNDLNQPETMSSMLLDDSLHVISAERRSLVGADVKGDQVDPRVRQIALDYLARASNNRSTREFTEPLRIGKVKLDPAIVTLQPLDLPDGKRWTLVVSSSLDDVDQVVGQFFRRAIIGASLVILAMTAVLVSTSTQMIRGRLRLERLQNDLLTRELTQAREIQLAWLPEKQEQSIRLDVAAMNRPASHISGDFYNWFELSDGRTVIVVGDVTGHGLPAAFLMATTQLLVRMAMDRVGDPGGALRLVNRELCRHVFSGQFVTMIIVVLDEKKGTAEIATAGHPGPLVGNGGEFTALSLESQLVLAIQDVDYITQRFDLKPGTSMLLYTDGVTDVRSPTGERLQIEGLEKSLFGRFDTAKRLVDAATDAIEAFRLGREPSDDLTLVAVQLESVKSEPTSAFSDRLDTPLHAAKVNPSMTGP